MTLWEAVRGEFLDVIEWAGEPAPETLVWRFPRRDDAIKLGSQLTVREGQWAVFVNEGRIADSFGPGRYTLETRNLPLLTTLLSLPTAFETPFKAEVYFVATRQFTDLKWGTRHPVILRDPELGPVRLRGYGSYALRIGDPPRLIREVSGSSGHFTVDGISEQLRNLVVTRLADLLGESHHPVLDLAGRYDELAAELRRRLEPEFEGYGISLTTLLIENLTLPPEVEAALDRRSGIALTGDLQAFTTYQAGIALEKAAANPGGPAGAASGLAVGLGLGQQLAVPGGAPGGAAAAAAAGSGGPPVPAPTETASPAGTAYHVLLEGEAHGPLSLAELAGLRQQGRLRADGLVWHAGLAGWTPASQLGELAVLFLTPPPPPPPAAPPAP
ncbi:SPFH domain-containing protein [Vulcanococcus limneticus]|uniref:SPFH domain-containing protein n=1 Tax=Vulcanococcus limneticus TaxID=2170428 RepID=UPI00398BE99D